MVATYMGVCFIAGNAFTALIYLSVLVGRMVIVMCVRYADICSSCLIC